MSEMTNYIVLSMVGLGMTLDLKEGGFGAPLHDGPGERWEGVPEAKNPVSPHIRDLTLWLIQNGCADPCAGVPGCDRTAKMRANWDQFYAAQRQTGGR